MRISKLTACVAGAVMFAGGVVTGASLDKALDPARAAPHIYKVKLDNERVRVLDVTLRNGEMAALHRHPDRLLVYLNTCAWLETTGNGAKRMQSYSTGDISWEPGMMHGGEPSNVVHDCRLLEVELKNPAGDSE